MAKWTVGQTVYARESRRVICGSITKLIGDGIFCNWPSEGVYDSKESEKSLYTSRPAPKQAWRR